MKSLVKTITMLTLAVGLILGAATPQAMAADTIKIGSILNFTGPIAFIGPIFKKGIEFALDEFGREVGGKKIEMVYEDAANNVGQCLEKAKKLVERDKVKIIIGPLMGDAQLGIAPYLKRKKVLISTLYCGDISLTKNPNWLIYPSTLIGLTAPVGWYAADKGYKTMITIGADYAGGRGFIAGIKQGFEERGGKVVQQLWPKVGEKDYGPTISNIGRADVIGFFFAGPTEVAGFLPQYHKFGKKIPLLGTTVQADMPAEIMKQLGDNVRGLEGQAVYLATSDNPANVAFREGFKKKYGQYPGGLEANAYTVTKAILTGLKATGGDDSFDKLRPAVLASRIETPSGSLAWNKYGVALFDAVIAKATEENGKWYWKPIKVYKNVADSRLK